MCTEAYVDDSLPALVTNVKESHSVVRDYTIAVLMERLSVTQTALTHASAKFYANLREHGESNTGRMAGGVMYGLGLEGKAGYNYYSSEHVQYNHV